MKFDTCIAFRLDGPGEARVTRQRRRLRLPMSDYMRAALAVYGDLIDAELGRNPDAKPAELRRAAEAVGKRALVDAIP